MDYDRVRRELVLAQQHFNFVEIRARADSTVFVKVALMTSAGNTYTASINLDGYPSRVPVVLVDYPVLVHSPHRYNNGAICYIHPTMWNPGRHSLTDVIARIAKWLNKYEIWRKKGYWPGASISH